jgi:diguanylate cyclase (GGDEF)-like protein
LHPDKVFKPYGYFERELTRLEIEKQYPISLVMADVDHLKKVNDLQGYAAGDELLKNAAKLLKSAFRSDDIVARIGGDEFAVIMPKTNVKFAKEALLRVGSVLKNYNAVQQNIPVSISLGTSTSVDETISLQEILKEADTKMYREKQQRR